MLNDVLHKYDTVNWVHFQNWVTLYWVQLALIMLKIATNSFQIRQRVTNLRGNNVSQLCHESTLDKYADF